MFLAIGKLIFIDAIEVGNTQSSRSFYRESNFLDEFYLQTDFIKSHAPNFISPTHINEESTS